MQGKQWVSAAPNSSRPIMRYNHWVEEGDERTSPSREHCRAMSQVARHTRGSARAYHWRRVSASVSEKAPTTISASATTASHASPIAPRM